MKYEYYTYNDGRGKISHSEIREMLPGHIIDELIKDERLGDAIYIEADKTESIKEIDKILKIGKKKQFTKFHQLEIDEKELDNYDYFRFFARDLKYQKDVFFEECRPSCNGYSNVCPTGAKRLSPVSLNFNKHKKIDFARINSVWNMVPSYLVSGSLKSEFDDNGVTGLEYEPCIDIGNEKTGLSFYVATVPNNTHECAKNIILYDWCKKCKIIVDYSPFELKLFRDDLFDVDFQLISKLKVGWTTYTYRMSSIAVSQKAMKIILNRKSIRLPKQTFFLQSRFLPLILTD